MRATRDNLIRSQREQFNYAYKERRSDFHVNPFGQVRRCPDFQSDFHWKDFKRYQAISCNACYYACRGEAQAPLQLSRVKDVMASPYA